ncbi:MAG: hypothetical protein R2705_17920 [Ilumatobacteraceae bacterium]
MDWTPSPGGDYTADPTFLYAPAWRTDGAWSRRPPRPLPVGLHRELRRRLEALPAMRSFVPGSVAHTELVRIPMGLPVPKPQAVVAFGAGGAASSRDGVLARRLVAAGSRPRRCARGRAR